MKQQTKNIHELLVQINEETGLNMYSMATKLGVTHTTIFRYWKQRSSPDSCKQKLLDSARKFIASKEYQTLVKKKGVKNISEELFLMCAPDVHKELIEQLNRVATDGVITKDSLMYLKYAINLISKEFENIN